MKKQSLWEASLTEPMVPAAWERLTPEQRLALTQLAFVRLDFETLEERGRDRLDFREVSVWGLREALARAFIAGSMHPSP